MIFLAYCEPVTLVTLLKAEAPLAQRTATQLQDMIAVAGLNLKGRRNAGTGGSNHRLTERVYHRIDSGEPRPIRQYPRRLILEARQKWAKRPGTCASIELSKSQLALGYSSIVACLLCYFLATDHASFVNCSVMSHR
jgi:hypothetical protein